MSVDDSPAGFIELRAGFLAEVLELDPRGSQISLPAYLYFSRSEWARAVEGIDTDDSGDFSAERWQPFVPLQPGWHRTTSGTWSHPSISIRASVVSEAGDVIVSATDPRGLLAIPYPIDGGEGVSFVPIAAFDARPGQPIDPNVPWEPIAKYDIPSIPEEPWKYRLAPDEACRPQFHEGPELDCYSLDKATCPSCRKTAYFSGPTEGFYTCVCSQVPFVLPGF